MKHFKKLFKKRSKPIVTITFTKEELKKFNEILRFYIENHKEEFDIV